MKEECWALDELTALPVFPFSDEFPYLSDKDMREFVRDVKGHGIIVPITLYRDVTGQAVVLDGRIRIRAAQQAGLTEVQVKWFEGDTLAAIGYVVSMNVLRTHRTEAQRAVHPGGKLAHVAAEHPELYKELRDGDYTLGQAQYRVKKARDAERRRVAVLADAQAAKARRHEQG